tara:strand:- start:3 stop:473 length:471 start_codon:yes stop_codon:yes gene_type:complete
MKFTKQQEEKLLNIDVSGKGGKDAEIALALGFERKSERFYDAVDPSGKKWEFKKQERQQWIDPYKLSEMTPQQKKISILFFMHKDGKITEVYETNYQKLIKAMGYSAWDLKAIKKMYDRQCLSERKTQIKAELKHSEIANFKRIWKRGQSNGEDNV